MSSRTLRKAIRFSRGVMGGYAQGPHGATRVHVPKRALSRPGLREEVETTLSRSPFFVGRRLRAELHNDEVVLQGVVGSYYQKQIAQETVRSIEGVGRVRNELQVQWQ